MIVAWHPQLESRIEIAADEHGLGVAVVDSIEALPRFRVWDRPRNAWSPWQTEQGLSVAEAKELAEARLR